MSEPEIAFGKGRTQIVLKGREAIRAAGWTIRFYLVMRAIAALLALAVAGAALNNMSTIIHWLLG